jgi:hypothetical protein
MIDDMKVIRNFDGTSAIQYWMKDGRSEILSVHELDLLMQISQELRLDGIHILSLEQALKEFGSQSDMLLDQRNESSKRNE